MATHSLTPGSRVLVEVGDNRHAFGTVRLTTNGWFRIAIDGERCVYDWPPTRVRPVTEEPAIRGPFDHDFFAEVG